MCVVRDLQLRCNSGVLGLKFKGGCGHGHDPKPRVVPPFANWLWVAKYSDTPLLGGAQRQVLILLAVCSQKGELWQVKL